MKNVPENELFSAYLDGEVTADEQAEIEELIATDPHAQQLLDELRALSATLQSLPTERVGMDLGDAVLRAAERRMLAQPPKPLGKQDGQSSNRHSSNRVAWSDLVRRILRPRVIVWSAIAAAVALMLTIATNDHSRNQLAQRPPASQPAPHSAAMPEIRAVEPAQPEANRSGNHAQTEQQGMGTKTTPDGAAPAVPPPDKAAGDLPSGTGATTMAPAPEIPTAKPEKQDSTPPPVAAPAKEPEKPKPAAEKPADGGKQAIVPHVLVVRSEIPASVVREGRLLDILAEDHIIVQPPKDASGKLSAPGPQHKLILIQGYATPAHVEAAIARLKARPETFSSVSLEAVSGEAALAWTSPRGPGSQGAGSDAEPNSTAPRRVRIGAVMSKTRPNVDAQVHFDREPVESKSPDSEKPAAAEPAASESQPKAAPTLPPPPSPELRRVIFAFQVVESEKAAPSEPAEK